MKLSEIVRYAADNKLNDGTKRHRSTFSCAAIHRAALELGVTIPVNSRILECGCIPWSYEMFNEFRPGKTRQGARYLWLQFFALYLEDEGL